jgi:hypothetical protein
MFIWFHSGDGGIQCINSAGFSKAGMERSYVNANISGWWFGLCKKSTVDVLKSTDITLSFCRDDAGGNGRG